MVVFEAFRNSIDGYHFPKIEAGIIEIVVDISHNELYGIHRLLPTRRSTCTDTSSKLGLAQI